MDKGYNTMTHRIINVEALDETSSSISIELANGSIIILELGSKEHDPLFAQIKELAKPKTDGERVYWLNGASLTLDEIMALLEEESED